MSGSRLLSEDVAAHLLEPLPLDVVAGSPRAGLTEIGAVGGASVGVWELSEGVVRDTEVDEVFVVLAGEGTVTFTGTGETLELRPGVAARLHAGERTEWTVRATLRKVYVAADR